jgi:hypothetical protein
MGHDPPSVWWLNWSGLRVVLLQRQMGAAAMVVFPEAFAVSVKTGLAEYDHVVQTLPARELSESLTREDRRIFAPFLDAGRPELNVSEDQDGGSSASSLYAATTPNFGHPNSNRISTCLQVSS